MLAHVLKRIWEKREVRRIAVMQLCGEEGGLHGGIYLLYVFLQKTTLTLPHSALSVPRHGRAGQKLTCAKTQPSNARLMKFTHNIQLHQSCVK